MSSDDYSYLPSWWPAYSFASLFYTVTLVLLLSCHKINFNLVLPALENNHIWCECANESTCQRVHCETTWTAAGAGACVTPPPRRFCTPGIKGSLATQPFSCPKTIAHWKGLLQSIVCKSFCRQSPYNNECAPCKRLNRLLVQFYSLFAHWFVFCIESPTRYEFFGQGRTIKP